MKAQDFSRSVYDSCVYMKKLNDKIFNLIILVNYVYDILILAKIQFDVDKCKNQLKPALKMKNLEESKGISGIDIHRKLMKKRLWLSHGKYIWRKFDMFNLADFKWGFGPLWHHISDFLHLNILLMSLRYEKYFMYWHVISMNKLWSTSCIWWCAQGLIVSSDGKGEQLHVESRIGSLGMIEMDSHIFEKY